VDIETFIARWSEARGGAERANYQMFLTELCGALDLPRPDPASHATAENDYVFERGVRRRESEGLASTLRIDLYKRGCFILEAKQSRADRRDDQPVLFSEAETASLPAWGGSRKAARVENRPPPGGAALNPTPSTASGSRSAAR